MYTSIKFSTSTATYYVSTHNMYFSFILYLDDVEVKKKFNFQELSAGTVRTRQHASRPRAPPLLRPPRPRRVGRTRAVKGPAAPPCPPRSPRPTAPRTGCVPCSPRKHPTTRRWATNACTSNRYVHSSTISNGHNNYMFSMINAIGKYLRQ